MVLETRFGTGLLYVCGGRDEQREPLSSGKLSFVWRATPKNGFVQASQIDDFVYIQKALYIYIYIEIVYVRFVLLPVTVSKQL